MICGVSCLSCASTSFLVTQEELDSVDALAAERKLIRRIIQRLIAVDKVDPLFCFPTLRYIVRRCSLVNEVLVWCQVLLTVNAPSTIEGKTNADSRVISVALNISD